MPGTEERKMYMDYDVKKIKHDLATASAKSKLDHAFAADSVPAPDEAGNNPEIVYGKSILRRVKRI